MKPVILLVSALLLCLSGGGCAKQNYYAEARVLMPPSATAQGKVLNYAQSAAFLTTVAARAEVKGLGRYEPKILRYRDTALLELGVFAADPQMAAQVANLMASVLTEYATMHEWGVVQVMEPAVAPPRR